MHQVYLHRYVYIYIKGKGFIAHTAFHIISIYMCITRRESDNGDGKFYPYDGRDLHYIASGVIPLSTQRPLCYLQPPTNGIQPTFQSTTILHILHHCKEKPPWKSQALTVIRLASNFITMFLVIFMNKSEVNFLPLRGFYMFTLIFILKNHGGLQDWIRSSSCHEN